MPNLNETIAQLLPYAAAILAVSFVVQYVIEGLKVQGTIGAGQAGKWNEGLSAVIGALAFVLQYADQSGEITDAAAFGQVMGGAVLFVIVTASTSKYIHLLTKWLRGAQLPKRIPAG